MVTQSNTGVIPSSTHGPSVHSAVSHSVQHLRSLHLAPISLSSALVVTQPSTHCHFIHHSQSSFHPMVTPFVQHFPPHLSSALAPMEDQGFRLGCSGCCFWAQGRGRAAGQPTQAIQGSSVPNHLQICPFQMVYREQSKGSNPPESVQSFFYRACRDSQGLLPPSQIPHLFGGLPSPRKTSHFSLDFLHSDTPLSWSFVDRHPTCARTPTVRPFAGTPLPAGL